MHNGTKGKLKANLLQWLNEHPGPHNIRRMAEAHNASYSGTRVMLVELHQEGSITRRWVTGPGPAHSEYERKDA